MESLNMKALLSLEETIVRGDLGTLVYGGVFRMQQHVLAWIAGSIPLKLEKLERKITIATK